MKVERESVTRTSLRKTKQKTKRMAPPSCMAIFEPSFNLSVCEARGRQNQIFKCSVGSQNNNRNLQVRNNHFDGID